MFGVFIFVLFVVFALVYILAWLSYKIRPNKSDDILRNPTLEAMGISFRLTLLAVPLGVGWFIWYLYDDEQSKKINERNIAGVWRSDEVILRINPDKTLIYKAFAGTDKDKNQDANWKLDAGVLYVDYGKDGSFKNYKIDSFNKESMTLVQKVTDENGHESSYDYSYSRIEE